MRISTITDKFVRLKSCRGVHMKAEWHDDKMLLRYKNDEPIADIFDYKDDKNYRLKLYPSKNRYAGRMAHNNRLHAVLYSVQVPDKEKPYNWEDFRYSSFIRYSAKIYDRKLSAEYTLERPMEFILQDGRLTLDYEHFESLAFPKEATPVVKLDANSNLQELDNKLSAILAGV